MSFRDQFNSQKKLITEDAQKEAECLVRKAKEAADRQAFLNLLKQKIADNPNYTFGDLTDEIWKSRPLRSLLKSITFEEIAGLYHTSSLTRMKIQVGRKTSQSSQTSENRKRILELLEKSPNRVFSVREIRLGTKIPSASLSSTLQNLKNRGLVTSPQHAHYKLNTVPARTFILSFLGEHGKSHLDDIVNATPPGVYFVEPTLRMLAEIGTIIGFRSDFYCLRQ